MLKYYAPIDFPQFAQLQQQCITWLLSQDLVHDQHVNNATQLDINELEFNCPTVKDLLTAMGSVTIEHARLYRVMRTFDWDQPDTIHQNISGLKRASAIEIPVIGCEHSDRVFYRARVTGLKQTANGQKYWACDESTAEEVARVRVMGPTRLDLRWPTRIELARTYVNRLSIILRVTPDDFNGLD